jgi:lysine 6-dehydrogenase
MIEYYLEKHLPKNEPDVVLIRITVAGLRNGQTLLEKWDCIDYQQTYSAMARTTAFPISIIAQFIANGTITERGVVPGEACVPFESFKEQLDKRGIKFQTSTFST